MKVLGEHFHCKCGGEKFNVILDKSELVEMIVCSGCGLTYRNEEGTIEPRIKRAYKKRSAYSKKSQVNKAVEDEEDTDKTTDENTDEDVDEGTDEEEVTEEEPELSDFKTQILEAAGKGVEYQLDFHASIKNPKGKSFNLVLVTNALHSLEATGFLSNTGSGKYVLTPKGRAFLDNKKDSIKETGEKKLSEPKGVLFRSKKMNSILGAIRAGASTSAEVSKATKYNSMDVGVSVYRLCKLGILKKTGYGTFEVIK
jgi:transcription elongation factor Elf1